MGTSYQYPVNLNDNEIRNVRLQQLASFPSHGAARIFYYTGVAQDGPGAYWSDGTAWHYAGDLGAISFGAVTPETSFGQATNDGSGTAAARADHTHGTPAHGAAQHSGLIGLDALTDVTVSSAADGDALVHNGTNFVNTPFDTRVRASRLDQMAAPTAPVSLNSQKITNLATPTTGTDAVTKAYADGLRQGLDPKDSVRAASPVGVNVNIAAFSGTTLDGQTLTSGHRILLKNQTTPSQNGIWVFNGAGAALTRAVDADATGELSIGSQTFVEVGTENGGQKWLVTATGADPWVPGTDSSTWTQDSGASPVTAGAGLTAAGNVFNVVGTAGRILVSGDAVNLDPAYVASIAQGGTGQTTAAAARTALGAVGKFETLIGDGAATNIVVTHNLNTRGVTVAVYLNSGAYQEEEPDVEHTSVNTITLRFTNAPTSNQYAVVVMG